MSPASLLLPSIARLLTKRLQRLLKEKDLLILS